MRHRNLFRSLQQPIRVLLYDTARCLHETDFARYEERKEAALRVLLLVKRVEKYQLASHLYIIPVLTEFEPGIADSVLHDQKEIKGKGSALQAVFAFSAEPLLSEESVAGRGALALFDEYLLSCTRYLQREQAAIEPLLCRYCTDAVLQQMAHEIINVSGFALQPLLAPALFKEPGLTGVAACQNGIKTAGGKDLDQLFANAKVEPPQRQSPVQEPVVVER